jgi:small conductance mechanosensitive channel
MQDNSQATTKNEQRQTTSKEESILRSRINVKFQKVRRQALFKSISYAFLFTIIAFAIRNLVYPKLDQSIVIYLQLAEIGIISYFSIRIVCELIIKLLNGHSETQARSAKSIIRIGGWLIVLAIVIAMLANDPYVTIAITTITGIALAISIQNIIGNVIAGMVLAIVRPFKIGDRITVLGITATVADIGLLYVRLNTIQDRKTMLVPNGTMLGTAIIREKITT